MTVGTWFLCGFLEARVILFLNIKFIRTAFVRSTNGTQRTDEILGTKRPVTCCYSRAKSKQNGDMTRLGMSENDVNDVEAYVASIMPPICKIRRYCQNGGSMHYTVVSSVELDGCGHKLFFFPRYSSLLIPFMSFRRKLQVNY